MIARILAANRRRDERWRDLAWTPIGVRANAAMAFLLVLWALLDLVGRRDDWNAGPILGAATFALAALGLRTPSSTRELAATMLSFLGWVVALLFLDGLRSGSFGDLSVAPMRQAIAVVSVAVGGVVSVAGSAILHRHLLDR